MCLSERKSDSYKQRVIEEVFKKRVLLKTFKWIERLGLRPGPSVDGGAGPP